MKFYSELKLPSSLDILRKVGTLIESTIACLLENQERIAFHMNLVVTEALSNAIKHGGKKEIWIKFWLTKRVIKVEISDKGCRLDRKPSIKHVKFDKDYGRGLFIISQIVDKMEFKQIEDTVVFTVIKNLNKNKEYFVI
jgi:serine/threonine-protein kinase RsbW